jgi:CoA:oxalate CoA-transferase
VPNLAAPLDGVKVLDFSQGTSGGISTKLMAVMGADVIKVEPPGSGDISRAQGPFPNDVPHPEKSGQFLYLNMNKRGVTLSLEHPDGRAAARRLVEWADIVVANFLPGQLDAWGLGYEAIEVINPGAILVSIAPFGQSGPYRDFRGNEIIQQALGGLIYVTGEPDREPLRIGGEPSEYFAGFSALSYIFTGEERGRHAASPLYRVADGQVGVILRQQDWAAACEMIGRPELEHDERFTDMAARRVNQEALTTIIDEWMRDKKKDDVYHDAQERGMAWGYIADTKDLMESPQYQHRDYFTEIDHPVAGRLTYPGMPLRWGDSNWELRPAPLLGQHNAEVYSSLLEWTPDDLVRMDAAGVI